MKKTNTELCSVESVENSPASMIRMAVSGGADLEQLEKLLALQERYETNEARKAYHKAMAAFKSNPIKITKDKKVGYSTSKGNVGYSHATLANVVDKITAELSKHGLSASWNTNQNGKIKVTCRITHVLGHSEETALEANADDSGSKNSIQAIGSTVTYLERYTLLAALGLATQDQADDDGKGATTKIVKAQLSELRDLLIYVGDEKKEQEFAQWLGVEDLEDLPASKFKQAQAALIAKKSKKDAKKEVAK